MSALDTDIAAFLSKLNSAPRPEAAPEPAEQRQAMRALIASLNEGRPTPIGVDVESRSICSARVSLRLYRPYNRANAPLLLFFHGGGFVFGDLDTHDFFCRRLSAGTGCIVAAIDYRLAPEHRFPAAHADAWEALLYLSSLAREGWDPSHILVCGDSAGGTLATATAVAARDRGGPDIAAQILICPSTDFAGVHPSRTRLAGGYLLDEGEIRWCLDHLLPDPGMVADPRVSPLLNPALSNLPRALIVTAGFDPLQDEGRLYGERLDAAGTPVEYLHFASLIHGFNLFDGFSAAAESANNLLFQRISALALPE